MWVVLQDLMDSRSFVPLVFLLLFFGTVALTIVVYGYVRGVRLREEAALKARLIERGASSAEIREILQAGGRASRET